MKYFVPLLTAVVLISPMALVAQLSPSGARKPSQLAQEPGTMHLEDLLKKPVMLKVREETPIYSRAVFDRALGSMAPGTVVKLVAMSEAGYRIRGRARHGDVVGWVPMTSVLSTDPNLAENLKKVYERQKQVDELVANRQVALGMTAEEVRASLGKPTRTSTKLNAAGKDERLEYAIFEKIPQYSTGFDAFGRPVQTVVYIKVETGNLSISIKDNVVDEIEETKGNPLGGGGVKIIPGPIFGF